MASNQVLAMVLAGGKGERLYPLTEDRSKPAVPFGGNFKLIDFTLSNCINSGFRNIKILTQYKSESLDNHISIWKKIHNRMGTCRDINTIKSTGIHMYRGTADAIRQNIRTIEKNKPDYVLILSSDHVYSMDYSKMLKAHIRNNAEVTIGAVETEISEATSFGVIEADKTDRIIGFEEKPENPQSVPGKPDTAYISMGIYIFNCKTLINALKGTENDFGRDIIPKLIKGSSVFAYSFIDEEKKTPNYWRDVGTIDSYYKTNMELVSSEPAFRLKDPKWPFLVGEPAILGISANSIIPRDCVINNGRVEKSVFSSGVYVDGTANITESILFKGVRIGKGAQVHKAIIEQGVNVPAGTRIGYDIIEDRKRFTVSSQGVVVVGAKANFKTRGHKT